MNKDIALKLALKELVFYRDWAQCQDWRDESQTAITAIKEALAQLEHPKVRTGNCLRVGVCASEGHKIAPQRPWVGLTEEEQHQLWRQWIESMDGWGHFYRAIEAKLKEKNS